jgi:hypothetical protein
MLAFAPTLFAMLAYAAHADQALVFAGAAFLGSIFI